MRFEVGYHCVFFPLCGQQWTESSAASSFLSSGVSMMFDTSSRRLVAGLSVTNVWPSLPACLPLPVHQMYLQPKSKENQVRQISQQNVSNTKKMEPNLALTASNVHIYLMFSLSPHISWDDIRRKMKMMGFVREAELIREEELGCEAWYKPYPSWP